MKVSRIPTTTPNTSYRKKKSVSEDETDIKTLGSKLLQNYYRLPVLRCPKQRDLIVSVTLPALMYVSEK